jgi:hypothetical protein
MIGLWLGLWCLKPLSTIFFRGGQFYWRRKPLACCKSLTNLYHIMLLQIHMYYRVIFSCYFVDITLIYSYYMYYRVIFSCYFVDITLIYSYYMYYRVIFSCYFVDRTLIYSYYMCSINKITGKDNCNTCNKNKWVFYQQNNRKR